MSEVHQVEVRQRSSNGLGIASLVLGILSCLICWIPFLGILAIPVAIIGILLGGIGFIIGVIRNSSKGGAIAGCITCILAIVISIVVTGKTASAIADSIDSAQKTTQKEQRTEQRVQSPEKTLSTGTTENTMKPENNVEWGNYEPGTYFVQGDMAVKIESLTTAKTVMIDNKVSKEIHLAIIVNVKNQSDTKKIEYSSWASRGMDFGRDTASLTDNFNNKYNQVTFGMTDFPKGQLIHESVYPGKEITDTLIFEVPVEKATELKLELPAANFHGKGYIRIKIPTSIITKK